MRALFVLTTSESKRLIGKAVARMEQVQRAMEKGKILIGHGSTNVYVIEEILGKEKASELWCRDHYVSGVLLRGNLCTILGTDKPPILILNKGKVEPPALTMAETLKGFDQNSVFIKGANCLDPEGNAAVFVAHPEGGTIGWAIGHLWAQGIPLITPVGLEKLIPSVKKAVSLCGQQTFDYCQGLKVGLVPMMGAQVVTEIEALRILTGVEAFHIASGGQRVRSCRAKPFVRPVFSLRRRNRKITGLKVRRSGACLKGKKRGIFPPICRTGNLPVYISDAKWNGPFLIPR
ncbi:MAG: hypothetical protein NTV04_20865 [Deltaproteobacteria bacterium]|nr:hypothetical protein [Deltaproteobacteria bacterium]